MQTPQNLSNGIFNSPVMARTYAKAITVARTDVPVLITGESGVGKEVVARLIHSHSPRASQPLIRVNCAALPNDLLESELFGHERGAFTGATAERAGKFEMANGGVILLDEIAEMSSHLQAKLLHVVQDGEYSRLGGRKQLRADARIIACTNRRLEEAVSRGEFRDDLYFRLNVIRIKIPPLRERKQEIPLLSNHFIAKYRDEYGSPLQEIPQDVLDIFLDYDWPGNVRELENVIKRYLILSEVDIEEVSFPEVPEPVPPLPARAFPQDFSSLKDVGMAADRAERDLILSTLIQTEWNRRKAAHRLDICYKALLNKIKKWQIERPVGPGTQEYGPGADDIIENHVCVKSH